MVIEHSPTHPCQVNYYLGLCGNRTLAQSPTIHSINSLHPCWIYSGTWSRGFDRSGKQQAENRRFDGEHWRLDAEDHLRDREALVAILADVAHSRFADPSQTPRSSF